MASRRPAFPFSTRLPRWPSCRDHSSRESSLTGVSAKGWLISWKIRRQGGWIWMTGGSCMTMASNEGLSSPFDEDRSSRYWRKNNYMSSGHCTGSHQSCDFYGFVSNWAPAKWKLIPCCSPPTKPGHEADVLILKGCFMHVHPIFPVILTENWTKTAPSELLRTYHNVDNNVCFKSSRPELWHGGWKMVKASAGQRFRLTTRSRAAFLAGMVRRFFGTLRRSLWSKN